MSLRQNRKVIFDLRNPPGCVNSFRVICISVCVRVGRKTPSEVCGVRTEFCKLNTDLFLLIHRHLTVTTPIRMAVCRRVLATMAPTRVPVDTPSSPSASRQGNKNCCSYLQATVQIQSAIIASTTHHLFFSVMGGTEEIPDLSPRNTSPSTSTTACT